jgi:hypothetical protein
MDKQDPGIRRYLADRADLLGARGKNEVFQMETATNEQEWS